MKLLMPEEYTELRRRGQAIVERLNAISDEAGRLAADLRNVLEVIEFEAWLDVIRPVGTTAESGEAGRGSHHQIERCSSQSAQMPPAPDCADLGEPEELPDDYGQRLDLTIS